MKLVRGNANDVFGVMELYQRCREEASPKDELFIDYQALQESMDAENACWLLLRDGHSIIAAMGVNFDFDNNLGKVLRLLAIPGKQNKRFLEELLVQSLQYLEVNTGIDILYTTTLSMSLELQEITLKVGFKILGVFPNLTGEDESRMNGLTAFYFKETIVEKRKTPHALTPLLRPFYQVAAKELKIDEDIVWESFDRQKSDFVELPELELIKAPLFVTNRFLELKKRNYLSANFYPFYGPNVLITDPNSGVEIFIRLFEGRRSAAIIGENISLSVSPRELYKGVLQLLYKNGVSYIEMINDAADAYGVEEIVASGFIPCSYLPGFKKMAGTRRDFIVFGKSFEYFRPPSKEINETYQKLYREYFKFEERALFLENISPSSGQDERGAIPN